MTAAPRLFHVVAHDLPVLHVLGIAFGIAYGGVMPLYALLTRECFGEKTLATAYGIVFFVSTIGMGLGSCAGGIIHDALASSHWLFLGSLAVGATAAILAFTLRPASPFTVATPPGNLAA